MVTNVRRWDGTQWVNATVRRWDGTEWVTVHDPDPPDPDPDPPQQIQDDMNTPL